MTDPEPEALFREINEVDGWLGGSGLGSVPEATVPYREVVQRLLDACDVRTVVDAGCGDWQISRLLDWSGVSYLGVDVVPDVVERNAEAFGRPNVRFQRPPFGFTAGWSLDNDVAGRWTKRMLLSVRRGYRPVARRRPDSAWRRVAEFSPS